MKTFFTIISMIAGTLLSAALQPSIYSDVSKLATGRWVVVDVDSTGIQEIDYATLRAAGFDRPEAVKVYGYGQPALFPDRFAADRPDDLPQQPTLHHGDKLLFYGEAASRPTLNADTTATRVISHYSFGSRYFLSDITADIDKIDLVAGATTVSGDHVASHTALIYIEHERYNPTGHGTSWFDATISSGSPAVTHVTAEGFNREWRPSITVRSVANNAGVTTMSLSAASATQTRSLSKSNYPVYTIHTVRAPITSPQSFNITLSTSATSGFTATDWTIVAYPRNNTLNGRPQQLMLIDNSQAQRPIAVDEGVKVWDVTSSTDVRPMALDGRTFAFEPSQQQWHHFIAFDPDAPQIRPHVGEAITNQNLHSLATPEMVVVTSAPLFDEALRLVSLHPDLDVKVVDIADVAREFGSGISSAPALRRFVKMLYDRNPSRLKYLLLVGDVSQDNRGIDRGIGALPAYECDVDAYMLDTTLSYWSMAYYGCLSDSYNATTPYFNAPSIAVGIIPSHTIDQLTTYLDNLVTLMKPIEQSRRSRHEVILMNDYGDNALYTTQANVHDNNLNDGLDAPIVHKVYSDVYTPVGDDTPQAREALTDALRRYPSYMLYIGHAEYNFLTSSPHWLKSDYLPHMQFPTIPAVVLSTCRTTAVDIFDTAIGAELLFSPHGGAGAVIGNDRFSLSNYNQRFSLNFTNEWIATIDKPTRIGDLWLTTFCKTVESYASNSAGAINTHKFILMGDPAMPLPLADATITASAPEETTPLSGDIVSGTTSIANGRLTATAYADNIPTYLTGRVDTKYRSTEIVNNDRQLWTTTVTVADGQFSFPLYMPKEALGDQTSEGYHLVLTAHSDDCSTSARTAIQKLSLVKGNTGSIISSSPHIAAFNLNPIESGNITNPDVTVTALIDGGTTGLMTLSQGLRSPVELRLDGKLIHNAKRDITPYGSVSLTVALSNLDDGHHDIALRVTDNAGVCDSVSFAFTVINRDLNVVLSVDRSVAHDEVGVEISSDLNLDDCRLVITDAAGKTVVSRPATTGLWAWNLQDDNGLAVAPGDYTLRVMARNSTKHAATPPVTVSVVRGGW